MMLISKHLSFDRGFDKHLCWKGGFFCNYSQFKNRTKVFGNYESNIDALIDLRKLRYQHT